MSRAIRPVELSSSSMGAQDGANWSTGDVLRGSALFVLVFAGSQVLAVVVGAPFGVESKGFYAAVFVVAAFAELGYALIARRYAGKYSESPWNALGIRTPRLSTIGWAICGLVAALALSSGYSLLVEVLDINTLRASCDEQIPAVVRQDARLLALAAFVVLVFAPTCEELFFRGFAYRGLANRWGVVVGIVASAMLFAAPHLTYRSLIPIFAAGVVFAATYWKSGNLLSTILAHTAFNAISIAAIASGACE